MSEDRDLKPEEVAELISDGAEVEWSQLADGGAERSSLFDELEVLQRIAAANSERQRSLPRRRLGAYRLVEMLGEGGMGSVYLAFHEKLQQPVAIKTLNTEAPHPQIDLLAEARTLARLQHSNIAAIHNFVQEDGVDYLVMEYVDGATLRDLMDIRRFSEQDILEVASQLADALVAAHGQGIVHRDLKPTNLMVNESGLKVLDFGLAQLMRTVDEVEMASTIPIEQSVLAGTVPYMSPEQVARLPVDGRADLFAVGIILYELATGERPFQGETAAAILSAIQGESPVAPRQRNPRISKKLESLILRLLEKRPADRIADAETLRSELASMLEVRVFRPLPIFVGALALVAVGLFSGKFFLGPEERSIVPEFESSIAVLPLFDLDSAQSDDGLLAAGVTDGLADLFGQLSGMEVISKSSVEWAARRNPTPQAIAAAVKSESVLAGSARNEEGHIDLDLALLHGATGDTLWAANFNEKVENVQRLYAVVALQVADELELPVPAEDRARFMAARAVDPEVYRLYLRARRAVAKYSKEGFSDGFRLYREATDLDPTFAPAYAGLAVCSALAGIYDFWAPQDALQRANGALAWANELDPLQPEAHAAQALIHMFYEQDWNRAEESFRRAYSLNPNYILNAQWYANLLQCRGRFEDTLAIKHQMIENDPLTQATVHSLGWSWSSMGEFEKSIAQESLAMEMNPEWPWPYMVMAWNLVELGRLEEANESIDTMWEKLGLEGWADHSLAASQVAWVRAQAGDPPAALAIARELEGARQSGRSVSAFNIGQAFDYGGDVDRALFWIETAVEERSTELWALASDERASAALASKPEYQAIRERLAF